MGLHTLVGGEFNVSLHIISFRICVCANTKGIGQMHFATETCIMIACVNHNGLPARGNESFPTTQIHKGPDVI